MDLSSYPGIFHPVGPKEVGKDLGTINMPPSGNIWVGLAMVYLSLREGKFLAPFKDVLVYLLL